jgi:hypothetical protein
MRSSVVLPAPLTPMMPIFSPRRTVRSTPGNTTWLPYALRRPSTRMTSPAVRDVAGNENRITLRFWYVSTDSIFSSALMRDCTALALVAWARNRSTNFVSRSRSRARFFALPARIVSSSARASR